MKPTINRNVQKGADILSLNLTETSGYDQCPDISVRRRTIKLRQDTDPAEWKQIAVRIYRRSRARRAASIF